MTDATDCQLLSRFVRHGDEAAFTTLARRHTARVRGVCRRLLRNEHDAEEVAQATFVVLARKAGLLSWGKSIGPWLSAVARRLALNARARRHRNPPPAPLQDEGAEPCVAGADPADAVAGRELCGVVRDELARLPEKYRAPVVLCYLEGKTNEQAARELGWPTGSMSRRLEKARRLLRERLADRGLLVLALLAVLLLLPPGLARIGPTGQHPPRVVAAMSQFEPGAEEQLRRAAEGQAVNAGPRLLSLAGQAIQIADRVEGHDPGHHQPDWKRYVSEMRDAARQLASAASLDDRPTTLVAAARLHAACSSCHGTFRD